MDVPDLDPEAAFEALNSHEVRYLVIGGLAAEILGVSLVTRDIDICYERSSENMARLAEALRSLNARLRVAKVDEALPFLLDGRTLAAGDSFTFTTDAGDFDVLATPSGTGGFPDLNAAASTYDLGDGLLVRVCSLDDLIRMKEAAGRPKDEPYLHELTALRDRIREAEDSAPH